MIGCLIIAVVIITAVILYNAVKRGIPGSELYEVSVWIGVILCGLVLSGWLITWFAIWNIIT